MAHHGSGPFNEDDAHESARAELMRKLLDTSGFRGAIGDFPEGKLTKSDEGAIQFAIGERRTGRSFSISELRLYGSA